MHKLIDINHPKLFKSLIIAGVLVCSFDTQLSAQVKALPQMCGQSELLEILPVVSGAASSSSAVFSYFSSHARCMNNHSTISCTYWDGSALRFNDSEYALRSFTLRAPSALRVGAKNFPVEIDLEHQASDGSSLVLTLTIKPGDSNAALDTFVERLPPIGKLENIDDQAFQLPALVGNISSLLAYKKYSASDKCSDDVVRLVSEEPISASAQQIKALTEKLKTIPGAKNLTFEPVATVERVTVRR